jgi:hypothetical protein
VGRTTGRAYDPEPVHGQVLAFVSVDPFTASSEPGRDAAFLVLLAFLLSFLFIRTSARMIRAQVSWWPGNVSTSSGLHLHHLVWGISLMCASGFAGFAFTTPADPWYQVAAIAFGIGAGLTFDEFALWVHLRDVYWSEQGRVSLDAVVLVTAFMGLVVIGTEPFGLEGGESPGPAALVVLQALVLSIISFLKGRIGLGALAVFLPGLGLWASLRLGRPDSPWARRRYSGKKLERARTRFPADSRGARLRAAFLDAIGGRPSEPEAPKERASV